jgi:DNA-binding response OmpR family regulator
MAPHRQFLLVDDDAAMRAHLARQLTGLMDCSVIEAGSAAQARAAMAGDGPGGRPVRFDAVLLDVDLPDGDGRDLCQSWRRHGQNVPVLMVTAVAREADVVRGLDAGANDYIAKPFRLAELAARLRAQLRAFESSEHAEIAIGPYVFRPGAKQLQLATSKRPIRLTDKEARVLKYLYRAQGASVARDRLLHEVWGYSANASTHTVETHIYRLRRKIESVPGTERLLVNDSGGYRLCLDGDTAERPVQPRPAARIKGLQLLFAG